MTLLFAAGVACGNAPPPSAAPPNPPTVREAAPKPEARPSAPEASPPPVQAPAQLVVSDRATLLDLEQRGFAFSQYAFGTEQALSSTRALGADRNYTAIVNTLRRDLTEARQRDGRAGVGMRFGHRLFDQRWLDSEAFFFELAGIVNRIDRRAFGTGCGELRHIFRLAYRTTVRDRSVYSRVPMTVNVVRRLLPDDTGGCEQHLNAWRWSATRTQAEPLVAPGALLSRELLGRTQLKSIEVNLQSVRWPSTIRPNMAGHAEYLMRVFMPGSDGVLAAAPLENTPDVARLSSNPNQRRALARWLSSPEALAKLDEGTLVVPEQFLARGATSVAPHGLARSANRPFGALFGVETFENVDLSAYQTFSTPAGMIRRLDTLSCTGCHQTRSIAGFHFLGQDDPSRRADVLYVEHSPHFSAELERRRLYLDALAQGQLVVEQRPSPEQGVGNYGDHCGLDAQGSFSTWQCREGLSCKRQQDADVGHCMPTQAQVGDACETGAMQPHQDSHRDHVRLARRSNCGEGRICEANGVGFPGGMCSGSCSTLGTEGTCGGIALLTEFNACLAASLPFETCILENTRPGALRRCSDENPCREDYVCATMPSGKGACIPPYFLFQLRVDGHIL